MSGEFDKARANLTEQIAQHEARIAQLKEKLNQIDQLARYSKPMSKNKYRSMGLTEAALDAVSALYNRGLVQDSGVTASQVASFLARHGMTMTWNFNVSLHITLDRLADSGRIKVIRKEGNKFFVPKDK